MSKSDKICALQGYYLNLHNELFYTILRAGGCIFQQQLCRLLNEDKTDTTKNTKLVQDLEEAQLIKVKSIGRNNLLVLTYPVFQYFKINRTFKFSGNRVKRSALIFEKYLSLGYGSRPLVDLKRRMAKTSALAYMTTGEPHLRLIHKYEKVLQEKGWDIDGLQHEERIQWKRFDHQTKFLLYENYPPLVLDKEEGELDLYNLECQNVFLSGIKFAELNNGKEQLLVFADIYNVTEMDAVSMGKLILDTQRTLESMFADYKHGNFAEILIQVYSHLSYNEEYEKKAYSYLSSQPEYIGNEQLARNKIRFIFFDTQKTLFSNISPTALV